MKDADTHDTPAQRPPDPVTLTENQVTGLVRTLFLATHQDWDVTRKTMDELMAAHAGEGEGIIDKVTGYADRTRELITVSKIIRESVESTRKQIAGETSPNVHKLHAERDAA